MEKVAKHAQAASLAFKHMSLLTIALFASHFLLKNPFSHDFCQRNNQSFAYVADKAATPGKDSFFRPARSERSQSAFRALPFSFSCIRLGDPFKLNDGFIADLRRDVQLRGHWAQAPPTTSDI